MLGKHLILTIKTSSTDMAKKSIIENALIAFVQSGVYVVDIREVRPVIPFYRARNKMKFNGIENVLRSESSDGPLVMNFVIRRSSWTKTMKGFYKELKKYFEEEMKDRSIFNGQTKQYHESNLHPRYKPECDIFITGISVAERVITIEDSGYRMDL